MRTRKTGSISVEMEDARRRLEEWRRAQTGRSRIPDNLWALAVEVARQHGIYQTSRTLRLDYAKLKQLLEPSDQTKVSLKPATFVELIAPQATSFSECSIELEGPRGKLRIQLKGTAMPDWAELSRVFLDCQS